MNLGSYRVSSLETGRFALDGGAMFGIVPKPMWEKTNPADSLNRIDMRLRCLLIQKEAQGSEPAQNILVDCGIGTKWAEKFVSIYKIDHSEWSLLQGLAQKGLQPSDITHVILTHLHFDHAGGLTFRKQADDPKSELLPLFPNAKVYLQKRNWDLAWAPSEKDRASYLTENYSLYKDEPSLKRKLELLETRSLEPSGRETFSGPDTHEDLILPGISVTVSNGHTLGMQIVRVSDPLNSSRGALYYCADLIPTATHVRVPFIMSYDCYPMFILEEKKKLLARAISEGSYLFYEHCPRMIASAVLQNPKGDYEAGAPLTL